MPLREVFGRMGVLNFFCQTFDTSEHSIEVVLYLIWNADIHFIFVTRIEGEIPLPEVNLYT